MPWARASPGIITNDTPGGRVAFFVVNGVDLPLIFPAAAGWKGDDFRYYHPLPEGTYADYAPCVFF